MQAISKAHHNTFTWLGQSASAGPLAAQMRLRFERNRLLDRNTNNSLLILISNRSNELARIDACSAITSIGDDQRSVGGGVDWQ